MFLFLTTSLYDLTSARNLCEVLQELFSKHGGVKMLLVINLPASPMRCNSAWGMALEPQHGLSQQPRPRRDKQGQRLTPQAPVRLRHPETQ